MKIEIWELIQDALDAGGTIEYDEVIVREKGEIHRKDGPAVVDFNGNQWWYLNGERHREGGPSVICQNGRKAWYRHGKFLSDEENETK